VTGPTASHYDTVVVGGAALGSSIAYWLSENPDYDGSVLVVEPDPTYEHSSTTLSEASVRHQFSNPVNIALSQFATEFIADFHKHVQVDAVEVRQRYLDVAIRRRRELIGVLRARLVPRRRRHPPAR